MFSYLPTCNRLRHHIFPLNNNFRHSKILLSTCSALNKKEDVVPKNPLTAVHSAVHQEKGEIYDRKPFKIQCVKGKQYYWCLCGRSKNQPFCDGTHKNPHLQIKLKPLKFTVEETKDYWLCNCKQTNHRPFCDGTHKELPAPVTTKT